MERKNLVEILSSTLLWETISANVEKLNQLPIMMKNIGYLGNEESIISRVTRCEILDSEFYNVLNFYVDGDKIRVEFDMPYILSAWADKEQLLRVSSVATGTCFIPDMCTYSWDICKFSKMNKNELLQYQSLVEIEELKYIETECDDVSNI